MVNKNLVLSPGRDPYTAWTDGQLRRAKWAAENFAKMGRDTHLRGFHYWLISQNNPVNAERLPYINTESCWDYVQNAVLWARYMGVGEWARLRDKKHPNPYQYLDPDAAAEAGLAYGIAVDIIPKVIGNLAGTIRGQLLHFTPDRSSNGYSAYNLVMFCEKNTMNDIIEPITRKYRAYFQPLIGESSLERAWEMCRAIEVLPPRPTRVFYISDFDPSGMQMPRSVARKLEFYWRSHNLNQAGADIKLIPLVLSEAQVKQYKLPGVPTKSSFSLSWNCMERFLCRVTEFGAVDTLHPGVLKKILVETLRPYINRDALDAIKEENSRLTIAMEEAVAKVMPAIQKALAPVKVDAELIPANLLGNFEPPTPDFVVDDADKDWMLDTARSYDEQLAAYERSKTCK